MFKTQKSLLSQSKIESEKGFTLLEVMVSMVLFLVVTGSVYGLLQVGFVDRNRASRRTEIMQNARIAIQLIGRDALNAGLSYSKGGAVVPYNFISAKLGTPNSVLGKRDLLTAVTGGNNVASNILQEDINNKTDVIAFAYRDIEFNKPATCTDCSGNVISLTNAAAASSGSGTTRLQTNINGAKNSKLYDLYLLESDSSQVAIIATGVPASSTNSNIDIAPGDPLGLNQSLTGTGISASLLKKCTATVTENCTTYLASLIRFNWVAYKVKSDGTLVRITYGNNTGATATEQIQELPIAYNVQDLQFTYVLEDGTVSDDPAAGPDQIRGTADDTPANFNSVRQINLKIKVQTSDVDEQTRKPQTITLNATFSTRNIEYDAG